MRPVKLSYYILQINKSMDGNDYNKIRIPWKEMGKNAKINNTVVTDIMLILWIQLIFYIYIYICFACLTIYLFVCSQ